MEHLAESWYHWAIQLLWIHELLILRDVDQLRVPFLHTSAQSAEWGLKLKRKESRLQPLEIRYDDDNS